MSGPDELITAAPAAVRSALESRLRTLLGVLADEPPRSTHIPTDALLDELDERFAAPRADRVWLAFAVLTARLPDSRTVLRLLRATQLDGARTAFGVHVFTPVIEAHKKARGATPIPIVDVVTNKVIVDVSDTAKSTFMTGIQRVARETTRRWTQDHDVILIGWHTPDPALRALSTAEQLGLTPDGKRFAAEPNPATVLVPWRCTYLLPELVAERDRVTILHAMLRHSGNKSGLVGHDCVPITTAETIASDSVGNGFAANLAAVAHADRVAATSSASAMEYRGWRSMLAGAGLTGPEIDIVALPAEAKVPSTQTMELCRRDFVLGGLPLVLVVGSHEPRKNHDAVLHAAELLWREGVRFSLLFIGGNAWNSERFQARVAALMGAGRPVHALSAVSDDQLWAAYRLAHCTIFPSINEGFGLPVAESLASGTPVITSNFGSMREIADPGGALLVDPRDDHDIAAALRRILRDRTLYAELKAAALARPNRTWDDYARELWAYLVPPDVG